MYVNCILLFIMFIEEISGHYLGAGSPNNELKSHVCPVTSCRPPFAMLAGSCYHFALSQTMSYDEASIYCQERGTDLATIKTGNELVEVIHFVKGINSAGIEINAWIGGNNLEGRIWKWIDGTEMPRGAPFWGTTDGFVPEPLNNNERHALLYQPDGYVFHNAPENYRSTAPLCKYSPSNNFCSDDKIVKQFDCKTLCEWQCQKCQIFC